MKGSHKSKVYNSNRIFAMSTFICLCSKFILQMVWRLDYYTECYSILSHYDGHGLKNHPWTMRYTLWNHRFRFESDESTKRNFHSDNTTAKCSIKHFIGINPSVVELTYCLTSRTTLLDFYISSKLWELQFWMNYIGIWTVEDQTFSPSYLHEKADYNFEHENLFLQLHRQCKLYLKGLPSITQRLSGICH